LADAPYPGAAPDERGVKLRKGNFGFGAAPDFARRTGLFRFAQSTDLLGADAPTFEL
jgi:hypothetical protein